MVAEQELKFRGELHSLMPLLPGGIKGTISVSEKGVGFKEDHMSLWMMGGFGPGSKFLKAIAPFLYLILALAAVVFLRSFGFLFVLISIPVVWLLYRMFFTPLLDMFIMLSEGEYPLSSMGQVVLERREVYFGPQTWQKFRIDDIDGFMGATEEIGVSLSYK